MKVRFRSLSRKSGRGTNPAPQCKPVQTRGCARTAGSGSRTHVTRHMRPRGRGGSSKDRRPRPGQALAPPDVIHTREEVHDPLTRRVRGNTTDEGERGVSFSKVFNGQIPKVAGVERRSVKPSDRHTAGLHGATGSGGRVTRRADSPARGPHAAEMQREGRGAHAAAAGRGERERARPGAAGTAPPASADNEPRVRGSAPGAQCGALRPETAPPSAPGARVARGTLAAPRSPVRAGAHALLLRRRLRTSCGRSACSVPEAVWGVSHPNDDPESVKTSEAHGLSPPGPGRRPECPARGSRTGRQAHGVSTPGPRRPDGTAPQAWGRRGGSAIRRPEGKGPTSCARARTLTRASPMTPMPAVPGPSSAAAPTAPTRARKPRLGPIALTKRSCNPPLKRLTTRHTGSRATQGVTERPSSSLDHRNN